MEEKPVAGLEIRHGEPGLDNDAPVSSSLPVGFHVQGFQKHSDGNKLVLIVRARPKTTWFFTLFALFWDLFAVPLTLVALFVHTWQLVLAGLVFGVAGALLTYAALRSWFNHTRITVDDAGLSIEHLPLRFLGDVVLDKGALAQVSVVEDRSYRVNNRVVPQWALVAHVAGQVNAVSLLSGLPTFELADAIRHELAPHIERNT